MARRPARSVLAVGFVAGLTVAGCGSQELGPPRVPPSSGYQPVDDVEISNCGSRFGRPAAELAITNSTEVTRVYEIVVELRQGGRRVAEMRATATSLQPGETVRPTAFAVTDTAGRDFTCELASVRSYPSPQRSQTP